MACLTYTSEAFHFQLLSSCRQNSWCHNCCRAAVHSPILYARSSYGPLFLLPSDATSFARSNQPSTTGRNEHKNKQPWSMSSVTQNIAASHKPCQLMFLKTASWRSQRLVCDIALDTYCLCQRHEKQPSSVAHMAVLRVLCEGQTLKSRTAVYGSENSGTLV